VTKTQAGIEGQRHFGLNIRTGALVNYLLWIVLLLTVLIFALTTPHFFGWRNAENVITQVSITGILAIGMTYVIISGGIDLSVGSVLGLSGVVAALLAREQLGVWIPLAGGILTGIVTGFLINGVLITKANIPPFIVTLAGLSVFRGATYIISRTSDVFGLDEQFVGMLSTRAFGVSFPAVCFLVICGLALFFEKKIRFARYIYAVGDNERAAIDLGLPVNQVKIFVYGVLGVLSAISGILLTARLAAAEPNMGTGYELTTIGAVIIGGTSLVGGRGSVLGTLTGILLLGVLDNGFNMVGVPSYYQLIVKGLIIVIAVFLDRFRD
jgi:ribose transport system permease protein